MYNNGKSAIEVLKEYGMSDSTISVINQVIYNAESKGSKLIDISKMLDILMYVGLTPIQIEKLLIKSPGIVRYSLSEFMKFAYVIGEIGRIDELIDSKYKIYNYKKMFIRHVAAEYSKLYSNSDTFYFLVEYEGRLYNRESQFAYYIGKAFGIQVDCDESLKNAIDEKGILKLGSIYNGKDDYQPVTVDEYLSRVSRNLYQNYIKDVVSKRSINV